MEYSEKIILKNGKEAWIRNTGEADGRSVYEVFQETHAETDFLLSYPDENSFTAEEEAQYLKRKTESKNEIEIIAVVDGKVVGCAGIEAVGAKDKVKHRADFGISVLRDWWGLGIGGALTRACIACAKKAGYLQLELQAVTENERALALYRKAGFVEYGRNPRGFRSRTSGFQELALMLLEL